MISARCQWRAIIAKVKLSFGLRQSIHIEAICVEIVCQIIGGKKIYGRRETCFNTNFQQALDYFQWCKASHRISVGCHVFQRLSFQFQEHGPIYRLNLALTIEHLDVRALKVVCSPRNEYSLAKVVAGFDAPAR